MLRHNARTLASASLVALTALGCTDTTSLGSSEGELGSGGMGSGDARPARILGEARVADLLRAAGFPYDRIGQMVCTARYESGFNANAVNRNTNGTRDRGLFQINSIHLGHTKGCPASSSAIFDPETNTRCAYNIYRLQGVNAWYGYKAHKSECDRTRAPAMSLDGPNAPATPDDPNAGDDMTPMTDADMYGDPSFGDAIVAPDRPELPGAPERAPREVPLAGPAEGPYSL